MRVLIFSLFIFFVSAPARATEPNCEDYFRQNREKLVNAFLQLANALSPSLEVLKSTGPSIEQLSDSMESTTHSFTGYNSDGRRGLRKMCIEYVNGLDSIIKIIDDYKIRFPKVLNDWKKVLHLEDVTKFQSALNKIEQLIFIPSMEELTIFSNEYFEACVSISHDNMLKASRHVGLAKTPAHKLAPLKTQFDHLLQELKK